MRAAACAEPRIRGKGNAMFVRPLLLAFLAGAGCGSEEPHSIAWKTKDLPRSAKTDDAARAPISVLRWLDATNVFPAQLGTPDANYDADNCELSVRDFADGRFDNAGADVRWLQANIRVTVDPTTVLAVAMYTRSTGPAGAAEETITLGSVAGNLDWRTGFTSSRNLPPETHDVLAFAFFIDVRRSSGQVVRLWQSAQGANYTPNAVFALPPIVESFGGTVLKHANAESPIYRQREACL
jgi:hypothetical protein